MPIQGVGIRTYLSSLTDIIVFTLTWLIQKPGSYPKIVAALKIDDRVFENLKVGLKSSFEDEQEYVAQAIANLTAQEEKFRNRLRKLYLDRLDGEVEQDTYLEIKAIFETELDDVRSKNAAHRAADRKYWSTASNC